ncbi:MAG: branched-chain amino acid ABC transporter permease [Deltaproteobacteria bacterium]|nr:branched-chain amino acid ABC transporter permease [Deltaproteobacteria bacterium]MBW2069876.1 branched-chain amino acid ABC transporter permease [Deltaproteobacteria bacterium]
MGITQVFINSIVRASELSLLSLGLTLVYDILGFANFAHTEYAVIGVYLALFLNVNVGLPILPAALIASVATGLFSVVIDRTVFKKLRGYSGIIVMVASLGLAIAFRNSVRAIWGATARNYSVPLQRPIVTEYFRITPLQIWIIFVGLFGMLLFHLLLHRTTLGKAMRATSDNAELSQASGIDIEKIITYVWFIAISFASLGGILIGMETYILPYMGFAIIIPVFCATILGGIGNPYGAILGALVLGFAENIGLYINFGKILSLGGILGFHQDLFIPTGYKPAISFVILIVVLLVKPRGILGKKKET